MAPDGFYYMLFTTPSNYTTAEMTCRVLGKELVPYLQGGVPKQAIDKLCAPFSGFHPDPTGKCWIKVDIPPEVNLPDVVNTVCPQAEAERVSYTFCTKQLAFVCRKRE